MAEKNWEKLLVDTFEILQVGVNGG